MTNENHNLLAVKDLKTWFPVKKGLMRRTVGYIKAVDGISFEIPKGKVLGLVGESGCGKTTAARTIIRLIPAKDGQIRFDNIDVLNADKKQLKTIRQNISMIFQDPYGSLNPRMTIGQIVGEPLDVHQPKKGDRMQQVTELLEKVHLPADCINRYPHEFSGGQRQRIGVARALVLQPKLVICDEPVSALDVSIQSQILNLLKDLQDEFGLTYLFIAHDLSVVAFFCDEIAVMYMGRIVEKAPADELYQNPLHPYTRALMAAIPRIDPGRRGKKTASGGEVPSIFSPPPGCPFHPRCPMADQNCIKNPPKLKEITPDSGHFVACRMIETESFN